jgi:hypothetical protein
MRKLIIIVTLAAAPLVAAAPATATAGHQAAVSSAADVVTAMPARGGPAHPLTAPPAPQARDAATPRQSARARYGVEIAVLPRHRPDRSAAASACAGAPEAPAVQAATGSALARAPPAAA